MSLIKIPQSSLDFLKNQDEIFNSGNLAEGPWNQKLSEKNKDNRFKKCYLRQFKWKWSRSHITNFKEYFGREEIMIQSNTMYGVKTIVGTAGFNLVNYIDCQIETLMPSFQDVRKAIDNYKGDKNKLVVMLSDIGGIINPHIEQISKFLKQENILLLEDAAHSFGSTLNKICRNFRRCWSIFLLLNKSYFCRRGWSCCN